MGGGVKDFNWRELMDETRRVTAHEVLGLRPGLPKIAILSENCAHWLMADLPGHLDGQACVGAAVSDTRRVHCAPCLRAPGGKLLFVGKLDGWDSDEAGRALTACR